MTQPSMPFDALVLVTLDHLDSEIDRMVHDRKQTHALHQTSINLRVKDHLDMAEAAASVQVMLAEEFPDDTALTPENWRAVLDSIRRCVDAYQRVGLTSAAAGLNHVRRSVVRYGETL